jgi:hypothetical protein
MNERVYIENAYGPINLTPRSVSIQTTIIGKLVRLLAEKGATIATGTKPRVAPDIKKKILYNNVNHEVWLIYRYTEYGQAIELSYSQLNKEVNNGKNKALRYIQDLYIQELAYHKINIENPEIEKLQPIADLILQNISSKLKEFVKEDSSLADIHLEDLESGIKIIVGHAFVECLILEEPL